MTTLSDPIDALGLMDSSKPVTGAVKLSAIEHAFWLVSRALLFVLVGSFLMYVDVPLRSIFEGDVLQQLEREQTKVRLDEAQLLQALQRELDELPVVLKNLRDAPRDYSYAEYERSATLFSNSLNRFEELFASRKRKFVDDALEQELYEVRDTSRRILRALRMNGDPRKRQLCAQFDLIERQISRVAAMSHAYVCRRSMSELAIDGVCP